MIYESVATVESQVAGGVKFTIAKMSFGRRADLMRQRARVNSQGGVSGCCPRTGAKDGCGAAEGGDRPAVCEVGIAGGLWLTVGWRGGDATDIGGGGARGTISGGVAVSAIANGAEHGRTKKLIVAFHFEFSNQAGWKCDDCRKSGLERKRRCGWLPPDAVEPPRLVWARRGVSLDTCPKPYITAESLSLVEEFFVRRRWRAIDEKDLTARQVQAYTILEQQLAAETAAGNANGS